MAVSDGPVLVAVVSVLVTELGDGRAGYASKPANGGLQANGKFNAYAIVYGGPAVLTGGTAVDPNADAAQTIQVTYVGKTAEQADDVRDAGRAALLTAGALTITGRALINPVTLADSTEAREDSSVQPPLWLAVDRYRLDTTPA